MQDLRQGNHMVYEFARTRRRNEWRSFYVYQSSQDEEKEISREIAVTFIFASQEVASLPPRTIRRYRPNIRGYRHSTIVVLTMNNVFVVRPERLVHS